MASRSGQLHRRIRRGTANAAQVRDHPWVAQVALATIANTLGTAQHQPELCRLAVHVLHELLLRITQRRAPLHHSDGLAAR